MERAFHIVEPHGALPAAGNHQRIYYGSETCELLLPDVREVAAMRKAVRQHRMAFSLVTPWLTDRGMHKVMELISALDATDEVIVNDLGLLNRLHEESHVSARVAGRLLIRQYRDPRVVTAVAASAKALRQAGIDPSPEFLQVLAALGIQRIEIALPPRGALIGSLPAWLHVTAHTAFSICSITRHCPWRIALVPPRGAAGRCAQPCRARAIPLQARQQRDVTFSLQWNAWINPIDPQTPIPPEVDRIVAWTEAAPGSADTMQGACQG